MKRTLCGLRIADCETAPSSRAQAEEKSPFQILNSRLIVAFVLAVVFGLPIADRGLPNSEIPTPNSEFPLTLRDDLGHEVTLKRPPERIISLTPGNTEILYALGLQERIVGVTTLCNYPPPALHKPRVGGMIDFNIEKILSLEPDFVLAVRGNPAGRLKHLYRLGVPVFAFDPERVEDIFLAIRQVGRICGVLERADTLVRSLKDRLERVRLAVETVAPRKRIYLGNLHSPYYSAGQGTFIGEILELAGGDNIAKVAKSRWPVLSIEQILVENPEVVFFGMSFEQKDPPPLSVRLEVFERDRIWSRTTAGKQGALFILDQDVLHRPGPRIVEAAEKIARCLYPERFTGKEGP